MNQTGEDFFRTLFSAWAKDNDLHRCGVFHGNAGCTPGLVYVTRGDNGTVKIGSTKDFISLAARMEGNRRQYGMGFTLLFALRAHCAIGLERKIHARLSACRVTEAKGRELFKPDDRLLLWVSRIDTFVGQPVTMIPAIDLL